MSDNEVLLEVTEVSKKYSKSIASSLRYGLKDTLSEVANRRHGEILRKGEFWALQDVSFKLKRGDCLSIMGRNGAGKSTLLKVISGLLKPDIGEVRINGHLEQILEIKAGFKRQLTGRENVKIRAKLLGMSNQEYKSVMEEIEDFTELGEFLDSPVEFYSSGMQARLGFAVSTMSRPDILLIDEVLAVGDLPFRIKCYDRLGTIIKNAAVIIVSHSLGKIKKFSKLGSFIQNGRMEYFGDLQEAIRLYQDSYSEVKHKDVTINPELMLVTWLKEGEELKDKFILQFGERIWAHLNTQNLPPGCTLAIRLRQPDGYHLCEWNSSRTNFTKEQEKCIKVDLGPLYLCPGYYALCVFAVGSDGSTVTSMSSWTHFKVVGEFIHDVPFQNMATWTADPEDIKETPSTILEPMRSTIHTKE